LNIVLISLGQSLMLQLSQVVSIGFLIIVYYLVSKDIWKG